MQPDTQLSMIRRWAGELGFAELGVSDLDLEAYRGHLESYLTRGHHGQMSYLLRNHRKRLDPNELVPGTARVICVRMDYRTEGGAGSDPLVVLGDPQAGYVSRYALGRDYHKVIRRRLAQLADRINHQFGTGAEPATALRAFTDSAPVLEKALAAKAGLGWIGKHSLLLSRSAGSWFFLGELFTSLPLPLTGPEPENHCGACKACISVCPTGAIVGPQQLDSRRCISYLTIEHRGTIPADLRSAIGNRIFGCDDCQLYCPWNRYATPSAEADFKPRHGLERPDLLELFGWSAATFDERTAGSALRRIGFEQWRRNLAIALGNAPPSEQIRSALQRALPGASRMVGEHVAWALARQIGD